jgi:hypothetical protein
VNRNRLRLLIYRRTWLSHPCAGMEPHVPGFLESRSVA